ncbi:hypothetical protein E2562_013529 [Oryza meyeriana var. granulata]|uniref:Uncharacterized protein n=1 Tax=Oryza meyeriana var. granulata TaxID=110450 RepID=A0A6G1BW76_9ORYZ|nr:hypothetical protein E2562_013529 [Oryza meyeriana var. granulata]
MNPWRAGMRGQRFSGKLSSVGGQSSGNYELSLRAPSASGNQELRERYFLLMWSGTGTTSELADVEEMTRPVCRSEGYQQG